MVAAGGRKAGRARQVAYGGDQDEELTELHKRFAALQEEARASHDIAAGKSAANLAATTGGNGASSARGARGGGGGGGGEKVAQGEPPKPARRDVSAELKKLDEQITALRRKHDELAHANMNKRRELDKMTDRLRDLSKESKRPTSDNPLVREIKALEKRLEKAVQRYDDAQEVRKTYEQIVRRLKDERITFANQLHASEATLKAKEADYEELLLMSHDANHSKEMAKQELTKFEAIVGEERKARERELQERRALVNKKHDLNAELERREKARREAAKEAEHAEELRRAQPGGDTTVSEADIAEEQLKIAAYEAAFREIKEATGVSDVNEVIQKFITQEDTHRSLVQMTDESQKKIDALVEQKRALHERVEALTYAAHNDVATLERVPSAIADPLAASAAAEEEVKAERQRHKYERMSRILINVKAGIQHLSEKLDAVPLPSGERPVPLSDDTLVDVLLQNEARLRLVLDAMRIEEEALEREGISIDAELKKSAALQEPAVENNLRIKDPSAQDDGASDEEFEEDLEEDIVDRETLKKQSLSILDQVSKKTKKRRPKKGGED
ncbi:hypothetical protein KFE25_012151 [Diacronema lutheri]|uniref:ODAD1 central coiled coil region domain-containing protein n=2 Tax=Diacronema lutheri TaxID=2081491 RepID=A0A8J5XBD1_DIALT|nr:hypothetical protein KFE25_012151 [Diacronema lutheri]